MQTVTDMMMIYENENIFKDNDDEDAIEIDVRE